MNKTITEEMIKNAVIEEVKSPQVRILRGLQKVDGLIKQKEIYYIKENAYMASASLANGKTIWMGEMYLKAFEELIKHAVSGDPYVFGGILLSKSGSSDFSIHHLFRRQEHWREFIEVTPRGFYRLALYPDKFGDKYVGTKMYFSGINENKVIYIQKFVN